MAKKIVQDVVPPQRSIRNIPLSTRTTKEETKRPSTRRRVPAANDDTPPPRTRSRVREERTREPGRGMGFLKWGIGALVLASLAYGSAFFFSGATVTVTPKQWSLPLTTTLTASKNSEALAYNLITVTEEASKSVPASGEENVEQKASGVITIFNTQGSQPQQLVKNTRFQTSNGLIFRINNTVTVPGTTVKNGTTVPGSLSVRVYADKAGASYNVGLADFTIPGFQGDPRFKTITAKSDPSSPIAGGFVGKRAKVSDTDLQAAYTSLEKELRQKLLTKVGPQVPSHQIFFANAATISFEKGQPASGTSTAVVTTKGVLTGVLFDKEQLSKAVAPALSSDVAAIPHTIKNWNDLIFTFKNGSETKISQGESIQFSLSGNALVQATIETEKIANALKSQKRSRFSQILAGIPAIATAELRMRPAWAWSFPKNSANITVLPKGQ